MKLTFDQVDILKELINIGVGRAASMLNTMLHSHVLLRVPLVEVLSPLALEEKQKALGKETLATVQLAFRGPFSGTTSLVFPAESAVKLVSVLTGDELFLTDFDSIRVGTLTEIGNIVLSGVMGIIGNEIEQRIHYSVPRYVENPIQTLLAPNDLNFDATIIWVQAQFTIEQHQIDGDIILVFEVGSFDVLLAALDQRMEA
ncbi:MAG: chemotaxis protein CheC [Chloroflexi bacterium]|nr:chemotaxis protein CheC [Chloroflexota bacterium]